MNNFRKNRLVLVAVLAVTVGLVPNVYAQDQPPPIILPEADGSSALEVPQKVTATDDNAHTDLNWFNLEIYKSPDQLSDTSIELVKSVTADVLNVAFVDIYYNFQEFNFSIFMNETITRVDETQTERKRKRGLRKHNHVGMSRDLQVSSIDLEGLSTSDSDTVMETGVALSFSGSSLFFLQPVQSQNKVDAAIIETVNGKTVNDKLIEAFHQTGDVALADIYFVRAVPFPSEAPSLEPSTHPSQMPSLFSSLPPTLEPSIQPTLLPSGLPTLIPTQRPTTQPSMGPSLTPSMHPSLMPSENPTNAPSGTPTSLPSTTPTISPSSLPTMENPPSLSPSQVIEPIQVVAIVPNDIQESSTIIYTSVLLGAAFILIFGLFLRKRRREDEEEDDDEEELVPPTGDFKNDLVGESSVFDSPSPSVSSNGGAVGARALFDATSGMSPNSKAQPLPIVPQNDNPNSAFNVNEAALNSGLFVSKNKNSQLPSPISTNSPDRYTDTSEENASGGWNRFIGAITNFQGKKKNEHESSSFDVSQSSAHQSASPVGDRTDGAFPRFDQPEASSNVDWGNNTLVSNARNSESTVTYARDSESTVTYARNSESTLTFPQTNDDEEDSKPFWQKFTKNLIAPDSQSITTDGSQETGASSKDSKQFINDLVWLEKRIADVREATSPPSVDSSVMSPIMQSIVCRDCFAPPGKLNIFIQSTKDGPCVHSVNEISSLVGQIFPGDLIIAVDNVDTRAMTADEVLEIMQAKNGHERKITVLHFDS